MLRDPITNNIVTVFNQYENQSALYTSGLDVEMRYAMPTTNAGRFTGRLNGVYIIKYELDGTRYEGNNGNFTYLPHLKLTAALDWDYGGLALTGRVNYQMGVRNDLLPGTFFTAGQEPFQTGVYPAKTASYTTFDLYGSVPIDGRTSRPPRRSPTCSTGSLRTIRASTPPMSTTSARSTFGADWFVSP